LSEKSEDWIVAEYRDYMEYKANEQLWNMTEAQLSHTPMSKEGGTAMSRSIKDIQRQILEPIKLFDRRRERRGVWRMRVAPEESVEPEEDTNTMG
jgi:hypothetical protein